MPTPESKEDLKRFLRFVTYLVKFILNFSEIDAPLRMLLRNNVIFSWQPAQERAFIRLKALCSSAPGLTYFDVNKPVEIHGHANQNGLGAVLMQGNRPVSYSSRAPTEMEKHYVQIEKETVSFVHGCKKFHCYRMEVTVCNDH